MIIFINNPKPFEAGVILRTLYYSTFFSNLQVYINGKLDLSSLVRYSRVPIYEIKEKIKFGIPIFNKNTFLVNPNARKTINDIKNIENLIIDFSGEYIGRFEEVRGIGIKLLHYEAISILYNLIIRKFKEKIPKLNNAVDKTSLYLARKLLEFMDQDFFSPKKLQYILQHIHKQRKIIIGVKSYKLEGDYKSFRAEYIVDFFDKNLRKISESKIIVENNIIKVPILIGKNVEYREFYLDKHRRRVYITRDFYVSEKTSEIILPTFFF